MLGLPSTSSLMEPHEGRRRLLEREPSGEEPEERGEELREWSTGEVSPAVIVESLEQEGLWAGKPGEAMAEDMMQESAGWDGASSVLYKVRT